MAEQTGIEWCDATFNPWWGCERVSPACAHCYADTFAIRLGMGDLWSESGRAGRKMVDHGFRFFGDKHWDEPLKWARTLPAKLGRRPRVFCASMADVFEERDELEEHRIRLMLLIRATPELDWLLLTKRPEAALHCIKEARIWRDTWPFRLIYDLPNLWVGVSIENARYTWRADVLRQIPAAVRFISAEPLLGSLYSVPQVPGVTVATAAAAQPSPVRDEREAKPLHAGEALLADADEVHERSVHRRAPLDLSGIDWVIIGGESGPKARPFHLEHAREIVRACREDVIAPLTAEFRPAPAVFVKQLGAKPLDGASHSVDDPRAGSWHWTLPLNLRDRKGGDPDEWPADLRIREFPRTAVLA